MAADPNIIKPEIKIPWAILFSFFIFTVGIIILGRVYYRSQITRINNDAQESLTSISLLKIRQIEQWHIERLGNAEQIRNNNPLLNGLKDFIDHVKQPEVETDIKKWTDYAAQRLDYNGVFIYDTQLNSRLAATQSDSALPAATRVVCCEVLKDLKVRMTDLYRNGPASRPAIDLVIPLVLNSKKQSKPFGVIVLRIDPAKTLFPLIQSWPTPSKSAETLLIRKDGDSVLYLNDLRHIQNTALKLKLPVADLNLPAAKAVNGYVGVVEGIDYRKVPVVGYVSSIHGLNWFIVAKIDKEEIQATLKRFSIVSAIVTFILILFVASVLLFWIRNQQFRESRENLRNELGRKQLDEALIISEARYRRLFEASRDGILILESETGLIVDVNPFLVEMLGVSREQFLKKSIWEIGFFKDIAASKDKFLELQQEQYVRYEDLPLETATGLKFHVEFVSNVYDVSGYKVIQCNIRDISKRKEMEDALRDWNNRFKKLSSNAPGMIYQFTRRLNGTFYVPLASEGIRNIYRCSPDDVKDDFSPITKVILPEDLERVINDIEYSADHLTIFNCEYRVQLPGEPVKWLDSRSSPEKLDDGTITWYGFNSDITELKNSESKLREEKQRIRTILDQVGDPIFVKDNDHRILLANQAFYDIFCMDEKSVIGYTLVEAVPENERHHFLKVDREVLDSGITDVREEKLTVNDFTRTIITRKIRFTDESGNRFLVGSLHDITDRKKTEDELHKSETEFRQTFDLSPLGIVLVSLNKRFIRANKAFSDKLGYEAEELIGKTISDVSHPDDIEVGMSDMGAILRAEIEKSQIQKRYLTKDGLIIWGETMISLIRDSYGNPQNFLAIIQDITARKQAEDAIRDNEKHFRDLIESLPQLFWTCRVDGPCDYLSRQWVEYTGIPEADQLGYRWLEQLHHEDKDRTVSEWMEKVKTKEGFDIEFRIRRNDGIYHWFKTRAVPMFDSDGGIIKWFGSNTDINEIRVAEAHLINFNKELENSVLQRTEQLEAANKELEAFSYSVSHDLRAPLRAVNSYTNILLEDYEKFLDDEGKRICGIISSSATQMGGLIDDLLSFSRIGRSTVKFGLLDMKSLATSVINELCDGKSKELANFKIGKLSKVYGDSNLMRIVWTNLISNAIKYSSKNSNSEIVISSSRVDHTITYSVQDSGVGFDMHYKHKLFGVFQRLHSEKDFEGNGVGLAIVQRIILKHGGKVWAEGEVDNGAIFYFCLPA